MPAGEDVVRSEEEAGAHRALVAADEYNRLAQEAEQIIRVRVAVQRRSPVRDSTIHSQRDGFLRSAAV
jgi:hypothetical protein